MDSLTDDFNDSRMEHERAIPKTQRERIIFCIDLDLSMDDYFMTGEKMNDTRINRTKQLLKWFIEQKSSWNAGHEFAIMILGEMAVWHMDFTSDTVLLSHAIDELYTMGKFSAFDTTSLFKEILDQSNIDEDDGSVVRAIMVYARSDVLPSEPDLEVTDALYSSRRFYYDCIYIHNKVTEVSGPIKPQHVYDRLTEMEDARSPGYYYELTRVLKKFSTAMGELLAHPAVRPIQDEVSSILAAPPSVRRMEELALQKQLQQEHQQLLQEQSSHETPSQQPLSTPKRQDHPATFKSPDNTGVGSPSQKSTIQFGTRPPPSVPASRPLGSPTPLRSPSAPPLSPQPALSSFVSSKERERLGQPRAKVERSNSGTSSGSGGGNGAGSGSGTGMDDAILI